MSWNILAAALLLALTNGPTTTSGASRPSTARGRLLTASAFARTTVTTLAGAAFPMPSVPASPSSGSWRHRSSRRVEKFDAVRGLLVRFCYSISPRPDSLGDLIGEFGPGRRMTVASTFRMLSRADGEPVHAP